MATKIAMKNRVKTVMESKEHLTTGEIWDIVHGFKNLDDLSFKTVKYGLTMTELGKLLSKYYNKAEYDVVNRQHKWTRRNQND